LLQKIRAISGKFAKIVIVRRLCFRRNKISRRFAAIQPHFKALAFL